MIWKVVRFVDNRIHLQQAAGATKVSCSAFYEHKLAQIHGLHNYSGSRADREYWSQDTRDAEKDIIKIKAHEKLLISANRVPLRNENSSANQDGSLVGGSAKTKCNKCQRQLYRK